VDLHNGHADLHNGHVNFAEWSFVDNRSWHLTQVRLGRPPIGPPWVCLVRGRKGRMKIIMYYEMCWVYKPFCPVVGGSQEFGQAKISQMGHETGVT
jgi:hypothetical protein